MRSLNISNRFELAAIMGAALAACSSTPAAVTDSGVATCDIEVTGNVYGATQVAACSSMAQDADAGGDFVLTLDTSTPALARILATIDLGPTPATGQLTNETVTSWDVTALSASSSCAFQAGSTEVPNGNFTLQLDSVDSTNKIAHGTLTANAYVHAPPTIDCNNGDIETITITF
jgi:hypothetical protein